MIIRRRYIARFALAVVLIFILGQCISVGNHVWNRSRFSPQRYPKQTWLHSNRVLEAVYENISSAFDQVFNKSREQCHVVHSKLSTCNKLPNFFLHQSSRSDFNQSIINFWHIQKTGGSTVGHCLQAIAKRLKLPKTFHGGSSCKKKYGMLANISYFTNMSYQPIIRGHGTLGVCDFITEKITKRKCSTFAVFRDPFDRAVSQYFFNRQIALKKGENSTGYGLAIKFNITEWLKQTGSAILHGFAKEWKFEKLKGDTDTEICKELNSSIVGSRDWRSLDDELRTIVDNLDRHFSMIGLIEDLETTFEMLELVYGLPFKSTCGNIHSMKGTYEHTNATTQKMLKEEAKQQLMDDEEIVKLLQFDILLYKRATNIFNQQKAMLNKIKHR